MYINLTKPVQKQVCVSSLTFTSAYNCFYGQVAIGLLALPL